jgi:hypothetical protein
MAKLDIKRNERDWAGQLISWIKSAIDRKTTVFQDATNDTGVKMKSGRTKFFYRLKQYKNTKHKEQ